MAGWRSTVVGFAALLLLVPVCVRSLSASDTKQQAKVASTPVLDPNAPKISSRTRLEIIRSLQSERVYSRVMFPQGKQGLAIKNGVIRPSQMGVAQMVAENGAAAKPGDRCVITGVDVKEKEIILEINGGLRKGPKWYQRIEIGSAGNTSSLPASGTPQSLDAHGSLVKLEFDKYVPEMTGEQVRALLDPIFDFKALTTAEAYQKTLPPKVREAIKNHEILVGMDKEMVVYAKGRAPQKIRDKDDKGQDYEEWIYGTPPEEVDFVRFKGNQVARLEIMTVDGQKIVKTEREFDLESAESEMADAKPKPKPANAPTLLRPGEEAANPSTIDPDQQTVKVGPQKQPQPASVPPPAPPGGSAPLPGPQFFPQVF
jgi:hypothetical protein